MAERSRGIKIRRLAPSFCIFFDHIQGCAMKLSTKKEQGEWLGQHITHRLRACMAGSPDLSHMLNAQIADPTERVKVYEFCRDMAMYEGRHAAVRWLIEFVGISSRVHLI